MNDDKNKVVEGPNKETQTDPKPENNPTDEMVSMSKADYDKAIQSAEDKLRTKYSKDIKALEDKIAALTPAPKTDAELAFEKRLAELEAKERQNEEKEKALNLRTSLQTAGIDVGLAEYLKPDVDTEKLNETIKNMVSARVAAEGYKPAGHQSNQPLSKEEFTKMSYTEQVELYNRDPELWKRLKN